MNIRFVALAFCLAMSLPTARARVTLRVGDPAPTLAVMEWIKGEPVTSFQPGEVYIIEFWATWCGPCQMVMPRLSALQKKYDGKLTVIGVDVRETEEASGAVDVVRKFVAKKGDQMAYTVAMDDPKTRPVFNAWMTAAGAYGIPTTFIVDRSGRIAWIGHPTTKDEMKFQAAIEETLEGKNDLLTARAAQAKVNIETAERLRDKKVFGTLDRLDKEKRYADIVVEADRLIAEDPRRKARVFGSKFIALLHLDEGRAFMYVEETAANADLMKQEGSPERYINFVAQLVASQEGLSPKAYIYAVEHLRSDIAMYPNEPSNYVALAQAYYHSRDFGQAISTQQAAIRHAQDQANKGDAEEFLLRKMKETLALYQNVPEKQ